MITIIFGKNMIKYIPNKNNIISNNNNIQNGLINFSFIAAIVKDVIIYIITID